MTSTMKKTIRHGDPIMFVGSCGRAEVERDDGLWCVTYEDRSDWYAHLDQACTVAHSLVECGMSPRDASRAGRRAQ